MDGIILRYWLRLRGRRYFPHALVYGNVERRAEIAEGAWIPFGTSVRDDCHIGRYSYVMAPCELSNTRIGNFCSIAPGCIFLQKQHSLDSFSTFPFSSRLAMHRQSFPPMFEENIDKGPIRIEHDVWIGANCIIMGGVTIHTGAVIAAGSVVTKDVAPYSIVGGVPAREIRRRFSDTAVERLLSSQWWEWSLNEIRDRNGELAEMTKA